MYQLLTEDAVRERYDGMLVAAQAERRAAHQVELKRSRRRLEKARKRFDRALEETFALPARPNPVTASQSVDNDRERALDKLAA